LVGVCRNPSQTIAQTNCTLAESYTLSFRSGWRCLFVRPGAVLARPDNRGIFIVRISCRSLEKGLPNAFLCPARKPAARVVPVCQTLWQIPPRRAGAELPDHRRNKQPVADNAARPGVARPPRKQILNPGKLIVPTSMPFRPKAPCSKAPYESRFIGFENPPNDDTISLLRRCGLDF
jgi:hypothetical protein